MRSGSARVTREELDDESLAAFIDNTLAPVERARVAAILARDGERYRDFLDAVHVTAAMRTASGVSAAVPAAVTPWRRRTFVVGAMLAAAALVVVFTQLSHRAGSRDTVALLDRVSITREHGTGEMARALGAGWDDDDGPVMRGDAPAPNTAPERLGALMAARVLAGTVADSAAWTRAGARIATRLRDVAGAAPLAAQLSRDAVGEAATRATRTRQLRQMSGDTAAFDAGMWIELARLSLRAGRADNLRSGAPLRASLPLVIASLDQQADGRRWAPALGALRRIDASRDVTTVDLERFVRDLVSALPISVAP